jgi:hypothetical protein
MGVIVPSAGPDPAPEQIGAPTRPYQQQHRSGPGRERGDVGSAAVPEPVHLPDSQPGTDGGRGKETDREKNPRAY